MKHGEDRFRTRNVDALANTQKELLLDHDGADNGCNEGLTLEMPSNDVSAYAIDTVYDTHLHLGL